ncbi:RidA family protein [Microbacterium sp. NPDC058389]|uniref:RidA family protein n=1 Tax=Microbacterium sp. NPDC058389 TaxID=3346475 RepID=UPI003651D13D
MTNTSTEFTSTDGGSPVSVSVRSTDTLFWLSGATAIPLYHHHPHIADECVLPDDIVEQARRVLTTIEDVLRFNGLGWGDVVKLSNFLTDPRDYNAVQQAITQFFADSGVTPASTSVGINGLSGEGARLEIDVVAVRSSAQGGTEQK